MSSDTRYVFDTNVNISAVLFNTSVPGRAFTRSLDDGTILTSLSVFEEMNDVLGREKFDCYVTLEEREGILNR